MKWAVSGLRLMTNSVVSAVNLRIQCYQITRWSGVLLEKLVPSYAQLLNSPPLMEPEGSLLSSQEPATGRYPPIYA
jgi:hypothetical protein